MLFAKWLKGNIGSSSYPITSDKADANFMGFYVRNTDVTGGTGEIDPEQKLVLDASGKPEVRLCNFELVRRLPGHNGDKSLAPTNGGSISAALQGRDNKAQGNALGNKTTNRPSPEGAK